MAKILLNIELNSKVAQSGVDQLKKSIDLIANSLNSIQPNKDLTAQLNALAKAFNALAREAAQVEKSDRERAALTAKLAKLEAETATAEAKRAKATSEVAIAAEKAAKATEQTREATAKADTAEQKLAAQTAKTKAEIEKLSGSQNEAAQSTESLSTKFGSLVERYAKFYATSLLVRKPLEMIKNALGDVGETLVKTENAVIELNRVLDDPQPAQEVSDRLYDLAYQYGSTFENASTIAANFARAGKSWSDSLKATEAALLAMNVAELNVTEASDGLLSIIAQFNMDASDLVDVVDKLNKTADKNPVSTQKLLQAIQRAGSAAKNANVSFDQTLGLITAISEATNRSGQNIGTAINSLIQYSTKNIDTFRTLSKESDEIVDRFKTGLASIVDVWNQVSVDIKNDKEARDNIISALGTDGLEELTSSLHDELGDLVSEMDGVYNVANTYRKNYFIALLDNMDRYMTVQEQLTDYQGYSQEENKKYMDTYTAKVNQLNDAWQKLANDEQGILGLKKSLVELGISLTEFVETSGGIITTISEISVGIISLVTFIESKRIADWIINVGDQLKNMIQLIGNLAAGTITAMSAAEGLQAAFGWLSLATAVINGIVGAVKRYNTEQQLALEQKIKNYEADRQEIEELKSLRKELSKLSPDSEEYRKVEEKIVSLLGDKKILLEDVAKNTEEYTQKVKELTDAEITHGEFLRKEAKEAAGQQLEKTFNKVAGRANASAFRNILDSYGLIGLWDVKDTDADTALKILDEYKKKVEEITLEYEKAVVAGKDISYQLELAYESNKQTWESLEDVYNKYKSYVDEETQIIYDTITPVSAFSRKTQAELQAIADEAGVSLEEVQKAFEGIGSGSAQAAEEVSESLEGISESFDKAGASAEEFTSYITNKVGGYAAAADAVKAITAAQKEYAEQGQLSLDTVEKLAKLGDEWIAVLFDETGAVDVNTKAVRELVAASNERLAASGYLIESTEKEADAVQEAAEKLKDYAVQIDEVQSSLDILNAVQKEYEETGSISIDTFQKLLDLGGEYLDLIIDEQGQLQINTNKVEGLIEAKKELIQQLIAEQTAEYAVNRLHYYMAQSTEEMGNTAVDAAQRIELAALALAHFEGNEAGAKRAADEFNEALAKLALSEHVLSADWYDLWANDVKNYHSNALQLYSMLDTSSTGWQSSSDSSKSSSSSKSTKDEYLETLKSAVSLRESELTLMQHQGATQDEQIAKIRQIQAGLSEEADYLRSIGASQEDINKLSSEWWTWEEKINKFAEDNAKAAEKAAEEQKKAAEEAEKAAKKAAEEAEKAAEAERKAAEEAIKAETSRLKQIVSDDKARLTLMEKQNKSVSERVEKMKEIQSHLHDEAEWLRKIGAAQSEIDALSAEWWDWQEKILKLYQEILDTQKQIELDAIQKTIDGILKEIDLEEQALELEEKRLAVDESRKNLEEAIAKVKLDYIQTVLSDYLTSLSDAETLEEKQRAVAEAREKLVQAQREAQAKSIIDAFKAEKEVKSDTLSLEEKRLAVEQARQALIDAENNRTTRVLNEATGQWEYQANARDVQNAKDSLKSAVDALNAYVEEAAWNEVAEAVENGSVSEAEVLEILSKWAKESYGNDSPEFVSKIQTAFRKAMGTAASPDSVSGQISAVDSAVKSLNDYLKQEAVKELKAYIAAGNTDFSGMRSILDKWLSMGEGSELYSWRDGLLSTVTDAIRSGYYDDTKVQSQVQAVENAVESLHDYLRSSFIREIEDIVKNGTADQITAAIERWSNEFDLSDTDRDWAERLASAKSDYERTEAEWNSVSNGSSLSDEEKRAIVQRMKANSEEWWIADEARRKELADLNYVLGTSMGWHRKDDGAWYDEYDRRLYDKGGVLRGTGGIKGTDRPEIVLDPELTSQILKPGSEAQFRAFADALHLMFERGGRRADDMPVIRNPAVTDSHNTSYTVNGIPIGQSMAERYTIAELFRTMPLVGAN